MFQLTRDEYEFLRSQIVTSKENKEIAQRLTELEHYFIQHCKDNQSDIRELREAIDLLMDRTKPAKIVFKTD